MAEGERLRFVDLFCGAGGFRLACTQAGWQCVYSCDSDSFCRTTYSTNFGEAPTGDIRTIKASDIPEHDVLVGGFPCQPFSIAGMAGFIRTRKAHGFADDRGQLIFDVARILRERQPKAFLLENVKHLRYHDQGRTFSTILRALEEAGYVVHTTVIDAQHYLPQHRERLFFVGFRRDIAPHVTFAWPRPPPARPALADLLEENVGQRYTVSERFWRWVQAHHAKHKARGNRFSYQVLDPREPVITRTLTANYRKMPDQILLHQDGSRPRKLTPRECARLMGFPDTFQIVVSHTQAYQQFGNAVAVPLATAVACAVGAALQRVNHAPVVSLNADNMRLSETSKYFRRATWSGATAMRRQADNKRIKVG